MLNRASFKNHLIRQANELADDVDGNMWVLSFILKFEYFLDQIFDIILYEF